MSVLCNPLFGCDGKVERVDAKGNNSQQAPKNDAAPQLETVAIKLELITVDVGVALLPLQNHAHAPRQSNTKRENTQQNCEQISANITPKATCEFRFHTKISCSKSFTLSRIIIVSHQHHFVNRQNPNYRKNIIKCNTYQKNRTKCSLEFRQNAYFKRLFPSQFASDSIPARDAMVGAISMMFTSSKLPTNSRSAPAKMSGMVISSGLSVPWV